jgi:hypothetical protein
MVSDHVVLHDVVDVDFDLCVVAAPRPWLAQHCKAIEGLLSIPG